MFYSCEPPTEFKTLEIFLLFFSLKRQIKFTNGFLYFLQFPTNIQARSEQTCSEISCQYSEILSPLWTTCLFFADTSSALEQAKAPLSLHSRLSRSLYVELYFHFLYVHSLSLRILYFN